MKIIYSLCLSLVMISSGLSQNLPDIALGVYGNSYVGGIYHYQGFPYKTAATKTYGNAGVFALFPLSPSVSILNSLGYARYGFLFPSTLWPEGMRTQESLHYLENVLVIRNTWGLFSMYTGVKSMRLLGATQKTYGRQRLNQTPKFKRLKNYMTLGMDVQLWPALNIFAQVQGGPKGLNKNGVDLTQEGRFSTDDAILFSVDIGLRLRLVELVPKPYYVNKVHNRVKILK